MRRLPIRADLHTHTVACGHAFCTIYDLAAAAVRQGLELFAVTEHSPGFPGSTSLAFFKSLHLLPPSIDGVRLLRGVEANLLPDGGLDVSERLLSELDWVMVGYHRAVPFDISDVEANTAALLAAVRHPRVNVIAHPLAHRFTFDVARICAAAAECATALEFNNRAIVEAPLGAAPWVELARGCAAAGTPVTVGSDAHAAHVLGHFDAALAVLKAGGVPPAQIVNRSAATVLAFLQR